MNRGASLLRHDSFGSLALVTSAMTISIILAARVFAQAAM